MAQSVVLLHKESGIATVTLNRPESLNALNSEMRAAFRSTMLDLKDDDAIGAIIVTGAGRAFSAGLDLRELGATSPPKEDLVSFISVLDEVPAPIIAAVKGYAITGGLELALGCDLIVAADDARFGDTHARVGVMPGGGMSVRLQRAVGIRKAKEMSLTGNFLDAEEALRLGLVNRIAPKDQVLAVAREMAEQIVSADHRVVRKMKRLINLASRTTIGEGLLLEQAFFDHGSVRPADYEARRVAVQARGRGQRAKRSAGAAALLKRNPEPQQ